MSTARVIKESETVIVDHATGEEIASSKTREIVHSTEPEFVKVYLACVAGFADYPNSLNPILLAFLKRMSYADDKGGAQVIYTNSHMKSQIAEECNVTIGRVDQALKEFTDSGCFFRVARATYSVNADYFGRGNWKDIRKLREIQAEFKVTKKGKKEFKAKFIK